MKMNKIVLVVVVGIQCIHVLAHGTFQALNFTENKGQLDSKVQYHCKLHLGDMYLEKNAFTFDLFSPRELDYYYDYAHNRNSVAPTLNGILNKHAYKMIFENANVHVQISASNKMEGYKNYYIGNDPSKWASQVYSYNQITYSNLYTHIDLELYASVSQLKYDLIVRVGGDASQIKVNYSGAKSLKIDEKGNLVVVLSNGEVKETKPYAYQLKNGKEVQVPCSYKLIGNQVTYIFPQGYNRGEDLIIDPILVFSSLTGSTADNWGFTATYDSQGNVYGGGMAFANGYPTTTGAYQTTFAGSRDIAISKFSANGTALLYSTYLGGSGPDVPHSLVNDALDNLIVLGSTGSNNYPTTPGCYDATFNGGTNFTASNGVPYTNGVDAIITKFNPTGTALIGSTYIGGTGNDGINQNNVFNYSDEARGEVVVDALDNIIVTCSSLSTNFPTTAGSHSATNSGAQDAVVFKMDPLLTTLGWSTYYGGSGNESGNSVRVAPNGNVYICGGTTSNNLLIPMGGLNNTFAGGLSDAFIAAFDGANGSLLHATYLGTSAYDQSFIMEIDAAGDIYTVGQTKGAYPIINAPYNIPNSAQYIHKLNSTLSSTTYSTVFGDGANTSVDISLTAFLVDNCGNVYVAGWGGNTNNEGSTNGLPTTPNAIKTTTDGSDFYFFVMERNATGLLYGSYFGSNSIAEHVDGGTSRFDKQGTIYQAACAGCGGSQTFPTTPGVWSTSNGSSNCNLGVVKIALDFQGISAEANVPPDIFLCASPFTVDFEGNPTPPPHVFWDFGDGIGTSTDNDPTYTYDAIGTYEVMFVAIDSSTCNIADTAYFQVTLQLPEELSAEFLFPSIDPCSAPDSILVSLAFTGTGADSIVWNMGNGDIIIDETNIDYYYTLQGTYTVTMTAYDNVCNNEESFSETFVYILTNTTANAVAPPDTTFCGPPPYALSFTATSNTPQHFWDFGDGIGNSTQANPAYVYSSPGQYTIMYIAIDPTTCNIADTVYFSVDINQAETFAATLNFTPPPPCGLDSMLVSLQFTGSGADVIVWNMGNGDVFEGTSVDYFYTVPGVYTVSMTAYDNLCDNAQTISNEVVFAGPIVSTANVPNVFTPNNDGNNDLLKILSIDGSAEYSMVIFNRWGVKVFETTDSSVSWDGTTRSGAKAADGVYFYEVKYTDICTTEEKIKTGYVHLYR
jgi:gliding motility-associated-like protein